MLSDLIIQAVVNSAMNKYALTHGKKKGWYKEDIREGIKAYEGNEEDFQNAMILALKTVMGCAGVDHTLS